MTARPPLVKLPLHAARRCTVHPARCFSEGVTLDGSEATISEKHYVLCERHNPSPFWQYWDKLNGRSGWTMHRIDALHDAMLSHPEELAGILLDADRASDMANVHENPNRRVAQ